MEKEKGRNISLLNLPESTLDCILKCLSPIELCRMSEVCTFFRDKCRSNHFWEIHIKHRWGRVIDDVVYKEWQWHIATAKGEIVLNQRIQNGSLGSFSGVWPNLCLGSYLQDSRHLRSLSSDNFMMSLYFSLESGKFWFPAQIYQGLMVQNALVSYDNKTDNFKARQQDGGWQLLGKNFHWDRVRVTPAETPPCVLHVSHCLDNLKPGDHIEIQWRRCRETPFDWWYAVIGHLESCDENENHCQCHHSDTLIVEFQQYSYRSYMRRILLSRKNNGEQGDRGGGFYGGIRKLHSQQEIERWKKLLLDTQMYYAPPGVPRFRIF